MILLTGHHRRHNKIIKNAKRTIKSGEPGKIVVSQSTCWLYKSKDYFNVWRGNLGGGPILINLVHDIDLMRNLIGEIKSVQCLESNNIKKYRVQQL